MTAQRVFYVTQGSLRISGDRERESAGSIDFADDDIGLREFDAYLAQNPEPASVMLVDVIEEEFVLESIPKLSVRDRKALIERRSQRKFRRTPYRVSVFQGKSGQDKEDCNVVYSAITNHELVDPWMQIVLRHCVPLSGVYSVPVMAADIFRKLFPASKSVMFMAPHQGSKLREVFFRNGKLQSARLAQSPGLADENYARFVVTEAARSRRYLERNRLLGSMEILDVCVVADDRIATEIAACADAEAATEFTFIDSESAARKLGQRTISAADRFEEAYLQAIAECRPSHSYAASGENRYWLMQRLRRALINVTVSTAAVCTVGAAILLSDTWMLENRIADIQTQVAHLSETFRRENEKFSPIRADSGEMKLAVDTGEFILANRLPVPWVMNQLGAVMGNYPDMQIRELRWLAEAETAGEAAPRRRSDEAAPVPLPAVSAVSAVVTGEIAPFDGNMRRAFARIDALVAELESTTHFSHAAAIEYPFDASTGSAISGSVVGQRTDDTARFRIQVTYDLPEVDNESI